MTPRVKACARMVPPKPYRRQIVLSFADQDACTDIVLSAGEAALLMFEIGRALEDADRLAKGPSADTRLTLKFPAHNPIL